MASVTFAADDSFKAELEKFSWVNWSEVVRSEALRREELERMRKRVEQILSKSKFTEKDAEEMGRKISESMHEQYKKKFPGLR